MAAVEAPSVRERKLARELRVLRGGAQLHGKDVAARLGWSASKVSRIETGRIGVSPDDLDRLLALYEVPAGQAAYLRRLAPSGRPKGWWDAYADTLSSGYASLIRMESGSRALRCYSSLVPHAFLQTPDYARQVILSAARTPSAAEVERRVAICRRRQRVLSAEPGREPLELSAVLDEGVLRRRFPSDEFSEVLCTQLRWLLTVAQWPNVEIRVLPFDAGLPPVTSGSFAVLESLATASADVVYLENKTRIFFIESEAEVHGYVEELDLLRTMALSPDASAALIEERLSFLTGPGGG